MFQITSVGGVEFITISFLLTGCLNSIFFVVNELKKSLLERLEPYFKSPFIIQPIFDSCAPYLVMSAVFGNISKRK